MERIETSAAIDDAGVIALRPSWTLDRIKIRTPLRPTIRVSHLPTGHFLHLPRVYLLLNLPPHPQPW